MTPEEQLAESNKQLEAANAKNAEQAAQIEAAKSSSNSIEAMQAKIVSLEKTSGELTTENVEMKLKEFKAKAIVKYPHAAGMPGLIGSNEVEIEASAKTIHENITTKTEAALKAKEIEMQAAWGKIPEGSVPNLLKQEDLDAEKDRISKIPDVNKRIVAKMGLSLGNLARKLQGATQ